MAGDLRMPNSRQLEYHKKQNGDFLLSIKFPVFNFKNNHSCILKHLILVTLIFPLSLGFATFTIRENLFPALLSVNFLAFNNLC